MNCGGYYFDYSQIQDGDYVDAPMVGCKLVQNAVTSITKNLRVVIPWQVEQRKWFGGDEDSEQADEARRDPEQHHRSEPCEPRGRGAVEERAAQRIRDQQEGGKSDRGNDVS